MILFFSGNNIWRYGNFHVYRHDKLEEFLGVIENKKETFTLVYQTLGESGRNVNFKNLDSILMRICT